MRRSGRNANPFETATQWQPVRQLFGRVHHGHEPPEAATLSGMIRHRLERPLGQSPTPQFGTQRDHRLDAAAHAGLALQQVGNRLEAADAGKGLPGVSRAHKPSPASSSLRLRASMPATVSRGSTMSSQRYFRTCGRCSRAHSEARSPARAGRSVRPGSWIVGFTPYPPARDCAAAGASIGPFRLGKGGGIPALLAHPWPAFGIGGGNGAGHSMHIRSDGVEDRFAFRSCALDHAWVNSEAGGCGRSGIWAIGS